jgi:hypothetical protein
MTTELTLSPRPSDQKNDDQDVAQIAMNETKSKVSSFLAKVRSSKAVATRRGKKVAMSTFSIVSETPYFQPLVIDDIDVLIPKRKRNLRPDVKIRIPQALQVQSCDLLVQVIGAKSIPVRVDTISDTILNKITINGNDYYYEPKENGIVYNSDSVQVGVFSNGKIVI